MIELLVGAMDELVDRRSGARGDRRRPGDRRGRAATRSRRYVACDASARASLRHRAALPAACARGTFVAPTLVVLDRLDRLTREVFGPVLHVVTFRAGELDALVDAINALGYGLTLGIHSRIDATIDRIVARARVGNLYVNRNMIGAVVGVQPFGGEGLSGTGPEGRRPALPVPLRRRADADGQHRRRGRQRDAARPGRRIDGRTAGSGTRGWQRRALPARSSTPSSRTPASGASLATRTFTDGAPNSAMHESARSLSAKRSSSWCGLSAASALMRLTTAA